MNGRRWFKSRLQPSLRHNGFIDDLKRMLEPANVGRDFSREELERMVR
jgi:hypothetical protein